MGLSGFFWGGGGGLWNLVCMSFCIIIIIIIKLMICIGDERDLIKFKMGEIIVLRFILSKIVNDSVLE